MNNILQLFPPKMQLSIKQEIERYPNQLEEIRLRVNQPVELNFFHTYIMLYDTLFTREDALFFIRQLSEHSLYRLETELQAGFITTKGGHRVGFAGETMMMNASNVKIKELTFFNIRLARAIKDIAAPFVRHLLNQHTTMHTLIFGAPQTGKTTFLRDIARQLSTNYRKKVGIIDERSEIAASIQGRPQLDVGIRTDVMDACPKQIGMMMMIRSMSPQVLIVDEIGSKEDVAAILEAMHAGVTIVCTIHCNDFMELKEKKYIRSLIEEKMFKRYVYLQRTEDASFQVHILNEDGHTLYRQMVVQI
ncbi:MAG TPA: stage III sporulation protein AA [Pseudogracilibacillus sp.]|nr:stage III sporulation protein AA [Pseudogracilibacillus sp.]